MRGIQKGISTAVLVFILLILGVAVVSGYFIFYVNQQKIKAINSYEDCIKFFPSLESFPAQCITSDGRRYVQTITEEQQRNLFPPEEQNNELCIQVITPAKDPKTNECKEFPTPCDVPDGWEKVDSCSE